MSQHIESSPIHSAIEFSKPPISFHMCEKCIMIDTMPGVSINSSGLCSECQDYIDYPYFYNNQQAASSLLRANDRMLDYFGNSKQEGNYFDAIVQLSGGKDSANLLHLLKNVYKQHVLAVSVVHPFLTSEAKANMDLVAKQIGCDQIKFVIEENLIKTAISKILQSQNNFSLGDRIGDVVIDYFYSVITHNLASRLRVSVIFSGLDTGQCILPVCITENKKQKLIKRFGEINTFLQTENIIERDSIYDLPGRSVSETDVPAFIAPLTFLPYNKSDSYRILHEYGITPGKMNKLLTNPDIMHFFDFFSYKNYGCESYRRHFARELRLKGYCDFSGAFACRMDRKQTLAFIAEQKQLVELFADEQRVADFSPKDLLNEYPNFSAAMGKNNLGIAFKRLKKITYYAKYFQITL